MSRLTWDETWLAVAIHIGNRSLCSRAQVGAVIVTHDNKVDSVGYNGAPHAFPHNDRPCAQWCPRAMNGDLSTDYDACPSIHSEANALIRADHSAIQGGTIYVSSSICMDCAKLISNSGLSRAIHIVRSKEQHRRPELIEAFLRNAGIDILRVSE
jgi:dCMP deaminase